MAHWNYRVTRWRSGEELEAFAIREVYYDDNGRPHSWTANPSYPWGEDLDWLKADYYMMEEAFSRPVLDITDEDNPFEVDDAAE